MAAQRLHDVDLLGGDPVILEDGDLVLCGLFALKRMGLEAPKRSR